MISSIPKWIGNIFEQSLRPNVQVIQAEYISPQIKKLRLQGNVSEMNFQIGYAHVIRVSDTEFRNYTAASYDRSNETMDVIFHIHGNGMGSKYIDSLEIGDELYISPPRGKKMYDSEVKTHLFFGDETSLGLACSLLPQLKLNQNLFHFYFELDKENEGAPELLGLEQYTLCSKKQLYKSLLKEEHTLIFETDNLKATNIILTGNVASIQNLKKMLKEKKAGKILSQGYWLEGKKGL